MDWIRELVKKNESSIKKFMKEEEGWRLYQSVSMSHGYTDMEIELIKDRIKFRKYPSKLPKVFTIEDISSIGPGVPYKNKNYSFIFGYTITTLEEIYSLIEMEECLMKKVAVDDGIESFLRYIKKNYK